MISCCWLAMVCWASALVASAAELPAWGTYHPWRRFQPGSWTLVETRTETLGADGRPSETSTTRTRTTLQAVTDSTYTLLIQSSVELGGREIESPPQTLTKGLWGDASSVVTVRELTPADPLELPDRLVPVRRFDVEVLSDATVCRQVIDFSDEQSPHVMQRVIECFARADHSPLYSTRVTTLNVDLPYRLGDRVLDVAHVQTLQKLKQGETLTVETFSREIPGGVTSHTSKELGAKGELLRRSTLALIDYHVAPVPTATREVGAESPAEGLPGGVIPGQGVPAQGLPGGAVPARVGPAGQVLEPGVLQRDVLEREVLEGVPSAGGTTGWGSWQQGSVLEPLERGKRVPWRERARHRPRR